MRENNKKKREKEEKEEKKRKKNMADDLAPTLKRDGTYNFPFTNPE